MIAREWELPDVQTAIKGRLKEVWKPILQISHGLSIHDALSNFVRDQQNERLSGKQNTLEGHIVKVVVDLHNEAKVPVSSLPFQIIWMDLAQELSGKLNDNRPHVMDTSEFFEVTKNKVGYRLREILSGETKVEREKDSEGNWISTKAYVFNPEKLRRVAKKYGYELVTKLPSLPSSESTRASESMGKEEEKNVEKHPDTPPQLGKLSNLVTDTPIHNIHEKSKEKSTVGDFTQNSVTKNDILIPCPFCKAQGKKMFFAADQDLKVHVSVVHNQPSNPDYVS
jgi:sarcosine oxidase delta subunit